LNGTIPETIGNPSELKHLDVGFNSLEGVVSEAHFLNLSKSQHLDLSYNSLTSQFPSYWMPPFNLDSLHLGFCDMGPRFPKWLVGQTNISELYISGARISDNIPVWFWNLSPYLSFLNLSNNQMSGCCQIYHPNILYTLVLILVQTNLRVRCQYFLRTQHP